MQLIEAIFARRTAHMWTENTVPETVLTQAVAAAQMAPCHVLTWPWRFTIPGPVARQELYEIGVQLKAQKAGTQPSEFLRKNLRGKLLNPALIVVSQVLDGSENRQQEDYAACACAIQNLCLSVTAAGYQSKWSTGGLTRDQQSYQILKIPPNERIVGFVWIGEPARTPAAPKRPPLTEVLRRTD